VAKSAKKKAAAASAPPAEAPPAPVKPAFEMAPDEPAAAATRRALLFLFEQMLAQQEGVLRGDDAEAVHDFRVAVRRTRSALGQVRGVFAAYRRDRFRESFAWLAGESNVLRDTDVLLEQLPQRAAEVCPDNATDLEPLREFLLGERAKAHQAMAKILQGAKYRRLLRSWRAFLEKPPKVTVTSAPNAERPIVEVARERIYAVYRAVRKKTRKFEEPVPAEELHQLRIDCKKLRYLLELFRSLFDADEIAAVLADLKHLQDLLGEMNDLEVQKGRLLELAKALEARAAGGGPAVPAATLFAMGRLAQRHERRQQVLRKDLQSRIHELTSGGTRGFFRGLCG
jgi:CHAD domain-containing protein